MQNKIVVTTELYKASIPEECSMPFEEHLDSMLCWGLVSAIEHGTPMNCGGCDESKLTQCKQKDIKNV
jgi:hypothetical protein